MNKLPSFPFYPGDWLDVRVMRMSYAAQGVYIRLLCHMWRDSKDQCSITTECDQLAQILGLPKARVVELLNEIQREEDPIFTVVEGDGGGRYISKRLQKERREYLTFKKAKSQAGRKGNEVRWGRDRSATDSRVAKDRSSPSPSPSPSLSPVPSEGCGPEIDVQIGLEKDPDTKHALLEYRGYLENQKEIPGKRVLEFIRKAQNIKQSIGMESKLPVEKIFRYALRETMKHDGASPSYIGKVIANAVIKYREGALKI